MLHRLNWQLCHGSRRHAGLGLHWQQWRPQACLSRCLTAVVVLQWPEAWCDGADECRMWERRRAGRRVRGACRVPPSGIVLRPCSEQLHRGSRYCQCIPLRNALLRNVKTVLIPDGWHEVHCRQIVQHAVFSNHSWHQNLLQFDLVRADQLCRP